ncbi:hypothetical protein HanRHA438_Chr16g0757651 [Helianthus annuus]|uniref:Uncharacterized protein n=1 Tax=Helianthus annuus TaxID=4232 RepID=A0A251UNE9_HELAN|nr:hypothetical protein HanXRQr2_Chr16g0745881 [Helianthus annuus]KAJ0437954.1 hypothetical protein HanHA300_Chr16g0608311 [Helianthus annuus]KAJ0442542.1 hypothetical protein HanIR_Chr16g0810561 [Helianthus annuus]KAJ0460276.1 hypothetical protein HanHA89_Chr16g0658871 [Helianthus annuus]KAJ0640714.1 hypothetical protein HanLR1_Chr16g0618831 [Helianthus annuus]
MDVDKIHPFSSTLGWHSLKMKGEVQTSKGLRWIPRHPETRNGVVSDEMLRGVENKHRSLLLFTRFLYNFHYLVIVIYLSKYI